MSDAMSIKHAVSGRGLAEGALRDSSHDPSKSKESEARYRGLANSYIRKPVDFEIFVEVAGTLGLYWLLRNEPPPLPRG